jgi:hypothetical protein
VSFYKTKRTTGNSLVKSLDRVFSEYIRLSAADDSGMCRCITCGVWHHWKDIDCGHFVTRNHKSTRWDIRNASPQCRSCNSFRGGEQYLHGLMIDKRNGSGTANMLRLLSKTPVKYPDMLLMQMIEDYREKVKKLRKEKGL